MMKIVFILFFLVSTFILNIFLYFKNDDYRFFIQKIKYPDDIIYVNDDLKVSDRIRNNKEWSWEINDVDHGKTVVLNHDKKTPEGETMDELRIKAQAEKEKEKNTSLSVVWVYILGKLSKYNLNKLEKHPDLFDLTNEYPDPYLEYDSKDLVFYYFPTKDYKWVLDVIEAISTDSPYFKINKANNFYGKSFYINVDKEFDIDPYVRFIFNYENNVFWIQVKKDKYNELKTIINKL